MKIFFPLFQLYSIIFICLFIPEIAAKNSISKTTITPEYEMKNIAIKKEYCCNKDGREIFLFTLTNANGMTTKISNYGGIILSITAPDKNGKYDDVVLGLPDIKQYLDDSYIKNNPHFGAMIGRYANRIAGAKFQLEGITYSLTINSRNKHNIHGGKISFDKIVWEAEAHNSEIGPVLKLIHTDSDGNEGFPGNLKVTVMYTLTNDNSLKMDYYAETDKLTVVNFTNHSFFNLSGEGNGNAYKHVVMINADKITPVDEEGIPTGELMNVQGTPYDFCKPIVLERQMDKMPRGFDTNYVLNKKENILEMAAQVYESASGRLMEVYTTEPGLHFFTANGLNGTYSGPSGKKYEKGYGLAFEAQHFPNSPNEPKFPSTVLRPGEKFHSITIYKFLIKKD
jgi:aldose 1-epimerase